MSDITEKKNKILINMDELIDALEHSDDDMAIYYLNKSTGEIIFLSRDLDEEQIENIEEEEENYIYIERYSSHESYEIMEDFIFSLADNKMKELLEQSIQRKRPFYNFKETLRQNEEIRQNWFKFYNNRMKKAAEEWLLDNELEGKFGFLEK